MRRERPSWSVLDYGCLLICAPARRSDLRLDRQCADQWPADSSWLGKAGRVDAIMPNVGDQVHRGDVVASVALPSQVGVGQNGQPKMGFLGAGDTHVDIQAPVDGVVIAVPVAVSATVSAGQAIISLVDPTQLWVNANIEETAINRVKVGQPVTVHVDALGADVQGKVETVTPATENTFSILPSTNTSGNFTKVTQLVPVRISVHLGDQPMLLGANVEVKIRVAD